MVWPKRKKRVMAMTTKEYLEQYREDVPAWLIEFQPRKSRPLADFLKSRARRLLSMPMLAAKGGL